MRRHAWWVMGLVLIGGGVALALAGRTGPDDVGWFAYSPSSNDPDWYMGWPEGNGSAWVVSRGQLAGGAILVFGLVVIAAGAGFRLGRRGAGPRGPQ